jgi:hypothetical protein
MPAIKAQPIRPNGLDIAYTVNLPAGISRRISLLPPGS